MSASPLSIHDPQNAGLRPARGTTASARPATLPRSATIAQALILAILFAVPAVRAFYHPCVVDPDIWWHISIGDWILQHGRVPQTDFMSRSVAGLPWQAYSWLFDLLVATLFAKSGLAGIVLYTAGMLLTATTLMYRLASRRLDFSLAVGLTFLVGFSIIPLETPRSWLFTIVFFLAELGVLMRVRSKGTYRDLCWIPVILALWANLHIQFVHGLILLVLAFAESLASRWFRDAELKSSSLWLGVTLLAGFAATLLNPYGWHIYRVAYAFGSKTEALNRISEVQSMAFRDPSNFAILFLSFAAVAALARQSRPLVFEKLLFTFAALIAFHSKRDVWMMAVVACAVLGSYPFRRVRERDTPRTPHLVFAAACGLSLVLSAVAAHMYGLSDQRLESKQQSELPVAAADFISAHHLQGPLYNDFTWGGYLYWRLHLPVSMDGRVAPFGDERILRSVASWEGQPDWKSDPLLQTANVVVGPANFPLTQLLRLDPHFHLVFEDNHSAVFTRF